MNVTCLIIYLNCYSYLNMIRTDFSTAIYIPSKEQLIPRIKQNPSFNWSYLVLPNSHSLQRARSSLNPRTTPSGTSVSEGGGRILYLVEYPEVTLVVLFDTTFNFDHAKDLIRVLITKVLLPAGVGDISQLKNLRNMITLNAFPLPLFLVKSNILDSQ